MTTNTVLKHKKEQNNTQKHPVFKTINTNMIFHIK